MICFCCWMNKEDDWTKIIIQHANRVKNGVRCIQVCVAGDSQRLFLLLFDYLKKNLKDGACLIKKYLELTLLFFSWIFLFSSFLEFFKRFLIIAALARFDLPGNKFPCWRNLGDTIDQMICLASIIN